MRRTTTMAGIVLAVGLGLTGCGDEADTEEVEIPPVEVPEVSPDIGEGEGEGEGESG